MKTNGVILEIGPIDSPALYAGVPTDARITPDPHDRARRLFVEACFFKNG